MTPVIEALGEFSFLLRWPNGAIDAEVLGEIHQLADQLRVAAPTGLLDLIPAYASLGVIFAATADASARSTRRRALEQLIARSNAQNEHPHQGANTPAARDTVEIPVAYGPEFGADFNALCQQKQLSPEQLIELHSSVTYTVAMLGFAPGFPYLIGLDSRLHAPRHASPRQRVPAGSVGIAGAQTGIYPAAGPGGWQLIGQTNAHLFEPTSEPPSLLQPGDRVRFVPCSP